VEANENIWFRYQLIYLGSNKLTKAAVILLSKSNWKLLKYFSLGILKYI